MRTAELTGLPERLELFFAQTTHLQGPVLSSSGGHCGGEHCARWCRGGAFSTR